MASETRLAEIRARLDAAISGPWYVHEDDDGNLSVLLNHADGGVIATVEPGRTARADAFLIAYAPTDLAYLLDEIARLTRELGEAREREKRSELAVGFIECAIGWIHSDDCDLLTTDDGDLREAVCELRNALDLLATPPAEGGGDAD